MSALVHKQTYAVQKGMSALPPKADIVCDKVRIMKPLMTRYRGRTRTSQRDFPHRVEMIVPKGGFGNGWTKCTSGTVPVASGQDLVGVGMTRTIAIT